MNCDVKILVPAYKTALSEDDRTALRSLAVRLSRYQVVFVVPRGLDTSALRQYVPDATAEEFDPHYFRGIAGYNELMMSEEFYSRFADCEYILIYQLDAYVFEDRLEEWCAKGYDYVGAPWLVRPIYKFPLLRLGSAIKHGVRKLLHKPDLRAGWWRVGNGGLSLRKVSSHLDAVRKLKPVVSVYLKHRNHVYNEDVFFSLEVNRHNLGFRYPEWQEALQFSFDKYPALCYKLNGNRLPMGCHAWTKKRMRKFWNPIIKADAENL